MSFTGLKDTTGAGSCTLVIAATDTLFDWQIDEIDAPYIRDGIFGGSIDPIVSISNTFGPGAQTCFSTIAGGRAIVRPGLNQGSYRVSIWSPSRGNATMVEPGNRQHRHRQP